MIQLEDGNGSEQAFLHRRQTNRQWAEGARGHLSLEKCQPKPHRWHFTPTGMGTTGEEQ